MSRAHLSMYPAWDLRCCYEAGACGFEVQRQLEGMGVECVVVGAAKGESSIDLCGSVLGPEPAL